LFRFLL